MYQIVLKKRKSLSIFFFVLAIGSAAYFGTAYSQQAKAGLAESSAGFAWGGGAAINGPGYDGIGWIGANNLSDGSAVNYGVNIPSADGSLSGYGWSEHYGWLSFNATDLIGCPGGTCTAARSGNALGGWARFTAIRDAGSNSGSWSGWVSLSGTAQDSSSYGVSIAGNALSGYAWSDELGWIDFSRVTISSPSTLKICQNSCDSRITRGKGGETTSFTMAQGDSQDLVACYNTAPVAPETNPCSDASGNFTDVTVWTESTPSGGPISLSTVSTTGYGEDSPGFWKKLFSPKALAALMKTILIGNTTGTESFTAAYNGITATMNTSVTCVSTNTCATDPQRDQVCTGTSYTINDGCGNTVTCTGNRYCDFNWREVAP